jgi:hypothetical protein
MHEPRPPGATLRSPDRDDRNPRTDWGTMPPGGPSADLRDEVMGAGLDLFAAYGIRLAANQTATDASGTPAGCPPVRFLGVCGFGGPAFTGHVILGASEGALSRSNKTWSSGDDWMAELANQFLGRIKNRLLRQGISVHRVPPVVIKGAAIALLRSHAGGAPLALDDGQDCVLIWLDSQPSTDDAASVPEPACDVLGEGEMLLF